MKKIQEKKPNHLLRQAREQRGWSQERLAQELEVSPQTVSRWECGTAFPYPHFREKLCLLFEKSTEALGLVQEKVDDGPKDLSNQPLYETSTVPPAVQDSPPHNQTVPTFPIWNVPYRRNSFFTGREDILASLHDTLVSCRMTDMMVTQAISGLGGVGKTQTAIEYAYRHRQDYRAVLWVRADSHETLTTEFMAIASLLNLPAKNEQDQGHIIDMVKLWLKEQADWLLILDNADDLEIVNPFLPVTGKGHILLTTRAQAQGTIAHRAEIERLGLEEGTHFLLRRSKTIEPEAPLEDTFEAEQVMAQEIALALDGLPLALDQAGAYIEETGCGLRGYLERYHTQRARLLQRRGKLAIDHPDSVATTLSLAFEKVLQACPLAAELLQFCAFLQPDSIPEELLTGVFSDTDSSSQAKALDPFLFDEAMGALRSYSLVRRNTHTRTLSVHHLVQVVLRDNMSADLQRCLAEQTVRTVHHVFPDSQGRSTWSTCQRFLTQIQACVSLIQQWDLAFVEAAQLLHRAGLYLQQRSLFTEAEPLLQLALAIFENTLGPEHADVVRCLNDIGALYYYQGRYAQAEPIFQRIMNIHMRTLGPDHLDVAQCLNDIALLNYLQANYAQAEPLFKQALTTCMQAPASDHLQAEIFNNLALLFRDQGKYEQAEPLFKQALAIRAKEQLTNHPETASILNNLASLYRDQGMYEQAEALFKQAIAVWEETEGPETPDMAFGLCNLATLYFMQGKYERAEPLYQQALGIREKVLGTTHRRVAQNLYELARLYFMQGKGDQDKYVQAEQFFKRSLAIYEKTLAPEHPDVVQAMRNYALLLLTMKREAEATELMEHIKMI